MSADLISRALARARTASEISQISRKPSTPGNAKPLTPKAFPGFPGFPGGPGNVRNQPVSTNRARAGADVCAGAGARECDDAAEKPGNPGNGSNINPDPFPDSSQRESEIGKSGKSAFGPLRLLIDIAEAVAPGRRCDEADLLAWWEERAGIREFDGGLDRSDAERLAYGDVEDAIRSGRLGLTSTCMKGAPR